MSKLLTAASLGVALVLGYCGFHLTASADDKPAKAEESRAKADLRPSYDRIMGALDSPTEFDFIETPLKDVVEHMKIKYGIEIQIDTKGLSDAGITADVPITRSLKGISLRSALRLMLRDHGLDFQAANEVLLITVAEDPAVREYDVSDLVPDGSSVDELENLVRFVLPRAQAKAAAAEAAPSPGAAAGPVGLPPGGGGLGGGGLGGIAETSLPADGEVTNYGSLLYVRASDRGHLLVTNLLEGMRHRMKGAPKAESHAESPDRPPAIGRPRRK